MQPYHLYMIVQGSSDNFVCFSVTFFRTLISSLISSSSSWNKGEIPCPTAKSTTTQNSMTSRVCTHFSDVHHFYGGQLSGFCVSALKRKTSMLHVRPTVTDGPKKLLFVLSTCSFNGFCRATPGNTRFNVQGNSNLVG